MSFHRTRSSLLLGCMLFLTLTGSAINLSPGILLTDPVDGAAWSRSTSASTVWTGDHYLSVWIEKRDLAPAGDAFLMAARFGAEGERIDGHGIQLDRRPEIYWARVLFAGGAAHVVYQLPGEIVVSRIGSSFQLIPIVSFDVSAGRAELVSVGSHLLVSWADWASGAVHAIVTDVATGKVTGPIVVAEEGYGVATSSDGGRFLVVYNRSGVRATFVSFDGIVEETILIDGEEAGLRPAAAFTGGHYLVSYGHPVRWRSLSTTGELGEIHSSSYPELGSSDWLTLGSTLECRENECLTIAEIYPICRLSACPVPTVPIMKRVDSSGRSLDQEWMLIHDGSYDAPGSQIASNGERFLVTWSENGRARGLLVDPVPRDPEPRLSSFPLSLGATSQRDPVGTDGEDQSLVVWSESGDDANESCLRAALIGGAGRTIAQRSISDCAEGRGSWSVSEDGHSWLAVWSEHDETMGQLVTRGRIMQSPDLSGESFVIAEEWLAGLSAAGGPAGHVVVWRGAGAMYATRVSSTGQIMGEPWPVLWGRADDPLLVRLGSGFAMLWDGGYCPDPECGFRYRRLTATGDTEGLTVQIAPRAFGFDAVAARDGGVFMVWRESAPAIRAGFIRKDGDVLDLGVIGRTDGWGDIHVGRDGDGFIVAVENSDGSAPVVQTSLLIRLDASGKLLGDPTTVDGRIQETIGDGLLLEQRHLTAAPFFGTPRLVLRELDQERARRRPIRSR